MGDNRWLFLFIRAIPCSYSCKHCLFAPSKRFKAMSYDVIVRVIKPFAALLQEESKCIAYQNLAVYVGDCALNCEEFPKVVEFLKTHHIEGWQSVAADGFRNRSRQEWVSYLRALKQAGTEMLEFSLYGQLETHDWFAGFSGSYEGIHTVANLWYEMGGKVLWSIFVHKRNLVEVPYLREALREKYGVESDIVVWEYLGWGAHSDNLRIDSEDFERLDEASQSALVHLMPEYEWIEKLRQSDISPFASEPLVIHFSIDKSGVVKVPYTTVRGGLDGFSLGNVFSEPAADILYRWEQFYRMWANSYPSIGELCRKYGDKGNKRLYSRNSIIRKWCAAFETQP